jgi:hypothetical protein
MDQTEQVAFDYLVHLSVGKVTYEPDGNVPPDFLVGDHIAVEVRRLNQNFETDHDYEGLEQAEIPLWRAVERIAASFGPPTGDRSWFLSVTFRRPLPPKPTVESTLRASLERFAGTSPKTTTRIEVGERLSIDLHPASTALETMFVMGGSSDLDQGGWVVPEVSRNLRICVEEKSRAISHVRGRYLRWWLILVDRSGFLFDEYIRPEIAGRVSVPHDWDRVLMIHPRDPQFALEVPRTGLPESSAAI